MTKHFAPPAILTGGQIDPRLAWLARAAARFDLVQVGGMDIEEAFGDLVDCLQCDCDRETIKRWERYDSRPRKWGNR